MTSSENGGVKVDSYDQNSDNKNETSHLNPMAKEFFPSSMARTHSEFLSNRLWFGNNFTMQAISSEDNGHFATRVCII